MYRNRFFSIIIILLCCLLLLTSCSQLTDERNNKEERTLFISAAASLTDVLMQLKEEFEADYPVNITFNFSGSGTLAKQIEQGAPVDLFISANDSYVETLIGEGLLQAETKVNIATNELVLIKNKQSPLSYDSIEQISQRKVEKIAIGHPETVPAGLYTKQLLKKLNKWDLLQENLVLAKDVRQVLTYVETGNVDIGFVFKTDALQSDEIDVILSIDKTLHDPITYLAAMTTDSKNKREANQFLQYMLSTEAQAVFEQYGFSTVDD